VNSLSSIDPFELSFVNLWFENELFGYFSGKLCSWCYRALSRPPPGPDCLITDR
jgi:hypothetical protein